MTTDLMENDAVPEWALAQLSSESRECLRNLSAYRPPDLPDFGLVKKAAVLIALYERDGALRVVLTTRAKTLRLIHAASVAYNSPPRFSRFASQQPPFSTAIANVVLELPGILESSKADSLVNASGEKKILEWGGTEKGQTWRSAETYEVA
ncbi:hypothetical protein P7C73_g3608, partial [Tremellales sp. Uapishka_1]